MEAVPRSRKRERQGPKWNEFLPVLGGNARKTGIPSTIRVVDDMPTLQAQSESPDLEWVGYEGVPPLPARDSISPPAPYAAVHRRSSAETSGAWTACLHSHRRRLSPRGAFVELFGGNFDRDIAAQARIMRLPHLAHAALAALAGGREDFIGAGTGTRCGPHKQLTSAPASLPSLHRPSAKPRRWIALRSCRLQRH